MTSPTGKALQNTTTQKVQKEKRTTAKDEQKGASGKIDRKIRRPGTSKREFRSKVTEKKTKASNQKPDDAPSKTKNSPTAKNKSTLNSKTLISTRAVRNAPPEKQSSLPQVVAATAKPSATPELDTVKLKKTVRKASPPSSTSANISRSIFHKFIRPKEEVDEDVQNQVTKLLRTPRNETELKELIEKVKSSDWLPPKPRTKPPKFEPRCPAQVRVAGIQRFINSFEYNHTGTNYFEVRKDLGMKRVCNTAKQIIRDSLPIKCIEAVFLAGYLTAGMHDITRIPVRFLSSVEGFHFRHIVLVLRVQNSKKWGALGLSRKKTLMNKPLTFTSLSELMLDYKKSYEELGHKLLHIGVGLPLSHNQYSAERIYWRPLLLRLQHIDWSHAKYTVDQFETKLTTVVQHVETKGKLPDEFIALLKSKVEEENPTSSTSPQVDKAAKSKKNSKSMTSKANVEDSKLDENIEESESVILESEKKLDIAFLGV